CALLTPLLFALGLQVSGSSGGNLEVPLGNMLQLLGWTVLMPLGLGLAVQRWLPLAASRLRAPSRLMAAFLLAAIIAIGLFNNRGLLIDPTVVAMFWLVVVHNVLAFVGGYAVARVARTPEAEARAVTLETGIQNAGLGLILIFNFYPDQGGMMTLVATWGVWHLVAGALLAHWWQRRGIPARG
ncbi:MAG: bile acid:sodium symporter family protein, partial [Algiphilus sp.]